jgi:hypothetical protein
MTKPFDSEASAKAREQSEFQRELYIRKHADDDFWVDLARESGINLPMYYVRPSDSGVKGLLRKLKLDWNIYLEAYGWANTAEFEALNPRYSMRALSGLILELWAERQRLRESCVAAADMRGLKVGSAEPKTPKYPRGTSKVRRAPLKTAA